MISLRIRAGEDRQAIAKQCGTSVEMLEPSYSFAIEDLEDERPKPAEEERLRARQAALAARRSPPRRVTWPSSETTAQAQTACFVDDRSTRRLPCPERRPTRILQPPCSPKSAPGSWKIREIPAHADVAQLVEHFTRNVSVSGLGLGGGFPARRQKSQGMQGIPLGGSLPRRGRREPRIDTAAARFAAPLQHRSAPHDLRPSDTGRGDE